MLKKRKHKIKRRNTEPSVNHPLTLAAQPSSAGPDDGASSGPNNLADDPIPEHPQPPVNLADICDSPTHATAV